MGKYKVFVSFVNQQNKRVWKLFRSLSVQNAVERVNLIAAENLVTYVRIERV